MVIGHGIVHGPWSWDTQPIPIIPHLYKSTKLTGAGRFKADIVVLLMPFVLSTVDTTIAFVYSYQSIYLLYNVKILLCIF